jgi:AraC-like DNA-binding protein/mannose-6-phosphate isomerase-like protein (cupin superfamily)
MRCTDQQAVALTVPTNMHPAPTLSLRHYNASPGSHSHNHFQILLGVRGVLELEVDGRGLTLGAGAGCVIAPGARHDFHAAKSGESVCLVLDTQEPEWGQCIGRAPHMVGTVPLAGYLSNALWHGAAPLALEHGPALLLEAWLADTRAVQPTVSRPAPSRGRSIDWPALQRWAQQQWQRPLSVADLAAQVHLSASQFAARCREEQGMGAMAWLRGQRLAQARIMRNSGMAVADVARRTGYRSPSALTAALRRAGGSPLARDDAPLPRDDTHA